MTVLDELVDFIKTSPEMKLYRRTSRSENRSLLSNPYDLVETFDATPKSILWALTDKVAYSKENGKAFCAIMLAVKDFAITNGHSNIVYVKASLSYRKTTSDNRDSIFEDNSLGMPFLGVLDDDLTVVDVGFVGRRPVVKTYNQDKLRKIVRTRAASIKNVSFGHAQLKAWPISEMDYRSFQQGSMASVAMLDDLVDGVEFNPAIHF